MYSGLAGMVSRITVTSQSNSNILSDTINSLTDTLRMLPAVYAPQTVATRASGQTQIEWPIGLAPAGGFG